MQKMTEKNKIVVIDDSLCTGCGECVEKCPEKILYIDRAAGLCRVTDESKCGKGKCCEKECPSEAIKIN